MTKLPPTLMIIDALLIAASLACSTSADAGRDLPLDSTAAPRAHTEPASPIAPMATSVSRSAAPPARQAKP